MTTSLSKNELSPRAKIKFIGLKKSHFQSQLSMGMNEEMSSPLSTKHAQPHICMCKTVYEVDLICRDNNLKAKHGRSNVRTPYTVTRTGEVNMAQNRFKFQSFSQRIAKIKIDVVHKIGEAREVPDEEQDTFFRESLSKWSELNCTQDFVHFYKSVKALVQNLKQLLFYKDKVFEILCDHLSQRNSACLDALLDLMAQLTRDLQNEIYPYFPKILSTLTHLLDSREADVIENTFVCLAFVFKYLWRYMINDSSNIFGCYKTLFVSSYKPHIHQFAAESMAFLIRKLKDKDMFLDILFQSVTDDPNLVEGVGILLFETIKGVGQIFHSCAAEVMSLSLKKLGRTCSTDDLENDKVFACLEVALKAACKHTSKDACTVLWESIFAEMDSFMSSSSSVDSVVESTAEINLSNISVKASYLVKLIIILVEWKSGLLIGKFVQQIQKMMNELLAIKASFKCKEVVVDLFAILIQTDKFDPPVHGVQLTVDLLLKADLEATLISDFVQKCKGWHMHGRMILPEFVKYIETNILSESKYNSEKSIQFIQCLCQQIASDHFYFKGPLKADSSHIPLLYCLQSVDNHRQDGCKSVVDVMLKHIAWFCSQEFTTEVSFLKDLDAAWCCVVLLPHLRPLDAKRSAESLAQLIRCCVTTDLNGNIGMKDGTALLISQAVKSFFLIKSSATEALDVDLDGEGLASVLRNRPSNVHLLQAFECHLGHSRGGKDPLQMESFQDVFDIVKHNLSSFSPIVRHLTLLILLQLSSKLEEGKGSFAIKTTLETCLNAEEIAISFETYLERLLHLRKLVFRSYENTEDQSFANDVVVRFLVGNLRVNLKPMWMPIMDVLRTHQDNAKQFWPVFKQLLIRAFESSDDRTDHELENSGFLFSKYISIASQVDALSRPDDNHFRLLMCQTMKKFPLLVQSKSRDVLPLFFTFLSQEYGRFDDSFAAVQDLSIQNHQRVKQPETLQKTGLKHEESNRRFKLLKAFLALFSEFKNPKALFQESKLYDIYMEMLMHHDNEIQQMVCNCLKTYKFDYLKPYEEYINKLFQDDTIRDSLTMFSASDDSQLVQTEHRHGIMNIITRIIYGKLQRRSGFGVSGKANQSARRNIITNFLSCCPDDEVSIFIKLITDPFKHLSRDYVQFSDVDFHHVIPLRKQVGFLNMLHTVLAKLSNLIGQHVDHLIKTLLNILTMCQSCLENRHQIAGSFIEKLKSIRQLCILRIIDFFEIFHDYNFHPYIEMIFKSAIMPQVSRLSSESQQHPSPILKLLHHWSFSEKYHQLLDNDLAEAKKNEFKLEVKRDNFQYEDKIQNVSSGEQERDNVRGKETPLLHVFSILSAKEKSDAVVRIIMNVAKNIMQMTDSNQLPMQSESEADTLSPSSIEMMSPHVTSLLNHFCDVIGRKKTQKKNPLQEELSVLALISSFAQDPEQCQIIVSLLFPTVKSTTNERNQCNTLVTIKNLVKNCENTKTISAEMVNLFMHITHRKSRGLLCDLFSVLSEKGGISSEIPNLICDMNSWDPKRVDEPDYELRLKAFRTFSTLLKARQLSIKAVRPVFANCLFFSVESQDMSFRDLSTSCINHVIDFVKESGLNFFEDLIQGLLLPVLRNALRSKNEIIRSEFIGILSTIVANFEGTPLSDMKILLSEDPEVEFFENIKHIQIHRRIRAVRQLQQLTKEKKLKQTSLFFYLLPLVSHFVFDSTSSKDHNLVTAAIAAIGAVMSCMSWQRYSHFLRSYLKLLPKEKTKKKTIIRIVVAILDAFHFDLSVIKEEDALKGKAVETKEPIADVTKDGLNTKAEKSEENFAQVENETDEDKDAEEDMEAELLHDDVADVNPSKDAEVKQQALRIHKVICSTILPQLQKSMLKKSFVEDFHRKSHNKEVDEDALLRVPIALALVKLLQKLPKMTLHEQLQGVLLRVCQTLKSRARDVRDTARDTLVNIAASLGPEYFPFVLKEMKSVLQRGYQLHVLAFTLKSLFDGLMEQFKAGDLDQCLQSIIQILVQDLFDNVTEEKEAEGITGRLHEAKSTKSFDSFEIVSRFATPSSFKTIVDSIRELLETKHTHKASNKAQEVLRRIGLGLQNNKSLSVNDLLIYINRTLVNLLPHLVDKESPYKERREDEDAGMTREDIYLVQKEPGRGRNIVESSKKANMHVLAEFNLQLFHSFLKNQRLLSSNVEHLKMLDPFVDVLINCIKSKYNRVIILAAKSIALLVRFPLPSFASKAKTLASVLFKLLKNYARIGAGTGDNYELVVSSFKAMTVIIRDNKKYKVTNEQLKILLTFVEEDIYDYTRQATAFPLLKAILSRKLYIQEVSEVMKKIAELSITSESDSIQLQCRQLMLQYLLDYPLGKKLENHLQFYVSHLEYELENGRKSSLEMMALIFKHFPENRLGAYSGLFYFPLAMGLVNDDSPICRKLTNAVLKVFLQKLHPEKRTELFELTSNWFQQDKVSVKKLAIQSIGIFAEVEKASFEKRTILLLPQLKESIKPEICNDLEDEDDECEETKSKDQLLFNTLSTLIKIIQNCDILKKPSYKEHFNDIWSSVQTHLQHPHTWVRLTACQLFTQLFAAWQPDQLIHSWKENRENGSFLHQNLPQKMKSLCQDFCEQLKSDLLNQELGEQIAKNLIYLTKVVNLLEIENHMTPGSGGTSCEESDANNAKDNERPANLRWILTKLSYLASYEASKEQKVQIKRLCIFRCLAAVSLDLGNDRIVPFLADILRPLHRELISSSNDSELYKLAQEVVELIKEIVGKESFAEIYSKLQRKVSEKKEARKRKEAEEAVVDPAQFAKKKQRKNLMKRDQRKRKLAEKKPSILKNGKKAKRKEAANEDFI